MTAQFSDPVKYQGKDYAIAGRSGTGLFNPTEHGMKPVGRCTACWRGFVCCYRVAGEVLLLDRLSVCLDEPALVLFGTAPKKPEGELTFFDFVYEDMAHPVPYTGGLLLGREFIEELYVHMGFHPAWKYRDVHELVFENGKLVRATDRSEEIAAFRREIAGRPLEPGLGARKEEIEKWVKKCFSQDYRW
jgi:hypothetical protein